MGIFDRMFGKDAEAAQQQPNAEQRFNELKQKYQTVLNVADQEHMQFHNLHVQDNKLYMKGTAPSEDAKNAFWAELKRINPVWDDINAEIYVTPGAAATTSAAAKPAQTYTV